MTKLGIPQDSIGWPAKVIRVQPNINLVKGKQYRVVLQSETSQGCYGFASGIFTGSLTDITSISNDKGISFSPENNRKLKYSFFIEQGMN